VVVRFYAAAVTRLFLVVPFRMLLIMFGLFGLVILAGGAVLVAALHDPTYWILPILTDALLLIIVVPLGIVLNRAYLYDIDRMLGGEVWAHWTYDEAGWRAANNLEGLREWRSTRWPGILFPVIGAGFAFYGLVSGQPVYIGVGGFLAGCGLAAALAIMLGSATIAARRRSRGEVYITPFGVYRRPGGYTPLFAFGQALRAVRLVPYGDVHYLCFDVVRRNQYGSTRDEGTRVLVTVDQIEDAQMLVERFQTEIFKS
jgi:hypothetical protein